MTGIKVNIITKATLACRNIYRISHYSSFTPDRKIVINLLKTTSYATIMKIFRKLAMKNEPLPCQRNDC
jgi:hypothetical protein